MLRFFDVVIAFHKKECQQFKKYTAKDRTCCLACYSEVNVLSSFNHDIDHNCFAARFKIHPV